eukprot:925475-Amphidinium_carterae.1
MYWNQDVLLCVSRRILQRRNSGDRCFHAFQLWLPIFHKVSDVDIQGSIHLRTAPMTNKCDSQSVLTHLVKKNCGRRQARSGMANHQENRTD